MSRTVGLAQGDAIEFWSVVRQTAPLRHTFIAKARLLADQNRHAMETSSLMASMSLVMGLRGIFGVESGFGAVAVRTSAPASS